uniref:HTH CENPB-type domain-containing protein n=1 Tax=Globisporangium ultimum (strain ATCC 200006 / CBS 805.95 / DAOM BR144) TaxID=431595 RepID=K3W5E4_GLOUD
MPTKPRGGDAQKSHLTIRQKIAIIQKKFEEPKWTQRRLGEWAMAEFRLAKPPTQATVSNILKTREQLLKTSISHEFCRVRAVKYPELDAAVHTWALSLERNGIRYSGEDIKEKALVLVKQMGLPTDLSFSNGWVSSFMERHQLKFRKSQGRGPDQMLPHVDRTGSASSLVKPKRCDGPSRHGSKSL